MASSAGTRVVHLNRTTRRLSMGALALACLIISGLADGQTSPPKAPGSHQSQTALLRVASEVAPSLKEKTQRALVVSAPLRSDTPSPRAEQLAIRLASLVTGALGSGARAAETTMSLARARTAAAASGTLVFLAPEISGGELRLSGDVIPVPKNIWDRARNPNPGPVAHGFANARIDAEVRSYLAPVQLVAGKKTRAPLLEREVLALLCDDLDRDGALELVVVSRRSLTVARIRHNRLSVVRRVPWEALSPISPVPWRQPLGSATMPAPAVLDVGVTDRARSLRLDGQLNIKGSLSGIPIPRPQGDACVSPLSGVLSKKLSPCMKGDKPPTAKDVGVDFDATAAARIITRDGKAHDVWAVREPAGGALTLRDGGGHSVKVWHVGAQVAVGDLDLDGDPELISSRNVLFPKNDALVVRTWRNRRKLEERFVLPVPDGVTAVSVCPPDGPGARAIALSTRKEVWIVR